MSFCGDCNHPGHADEVCMEPEEGALGTSICGCREDNPADHNPYLRGYNGGFGMGYHYGFVDGEMQRDPAAADLISKLLSALAELNEAHDCHCDAHVNARKLLGLPRDDEWIVGLKAGQRW